MQSDQRTQSGRNRPYRALRWLVLILPLLLLAGGIRFILADPDIPLLVNEGDAAWIRFPAPFQLPIRQPGESFTRFRTRLEIPDVPERAILVLRAMKQAELFLDGRPLFRTPGGPERWKETHRIDLKPWLAKGVHELRADVFHGNGHPALLAYCESLGIASGGSWEASDDGLRWRPAIRADDLSALPISRRFPRSDQALGSLFPLLLPVFALFFFWSLRPVKPLSPSWMDRVRLSAPAARWLVLGGWLAMAVTNFWNIPLTMGMDHQGHAAYIEAIAGHWRLPLASEGWQMFQPPLFHLAAALLSKAFAPVVEPDTGVRIMKLLPLLCGMGQVEICYRVLRYAYPGRETLQVIGTLFGGLVPMNLYMSQSLGNEPLAGLLTGLIVLFACRILSGERQPDLRESILMGVTLGLALLAKVTPLLIFLSVLIHLSAEIIRRSGANGNRIGRAAGFTITFAGTALAVAGWYYLRNWAETGRVFVGGWDSVRGILWWQDPGYRTPGQLFAFGESLLYPVYSSVFGFWDSLYSSFWMDGFLSAHYDVPWNFPYMLSSAWLSLLPSAAILTGLVAACRRPDGPVRRILLFSLTCTGLYMAAIFYHFLTVPVLGSAKASYALGLIPCFTLLAAEGFEMMTRMRFARAVVHGLFACWILVAYAAYWVP
ncbi:MAG: hypothetical protein AB1558_06510 [Thermodesulfobacteriota bacterium]